MTVAPARPPLVEPALASPRPGRWPSLDVFRGLALGLMIVHHFAHWSGGRVRERFVGFPGMVVTDLAAPAFALGLGAAAFLVGQQVRAHDTPWRELRWPRLARAVRRYGEVMALGLAIDVAVGGGIDGGGVLPTLAVLGLAISALSALGVVHPGAWWALAALAVTAAVPVTRATPHGFFAELWAGPFSVVVYMVFAAAGAGLAAGARGRGEAGLPLVRAALAVVAAGTAGGLLVPAAVAPGGLWPPDRHPGHLAFTMWGLAGSLLLWALVRRAVSPAGGLGIGLARAGRRTLSVFGLHYLVKLVLQHTGLLGHFDTWRWGLVVWAATAAACALAMAPRPSLSRPRTSSPGDSTTVRGRALTPGGISG